MCIIMLFLLEERKALTNSCIKYVLDFSQTEEEILQPIPFDYISELCIGS